MNTPTNDYDALVATLKTAMTTPSDEKYVEYIDAAEKIAQNLSNREIDKAKHQVLVSFNKRFWILRD